MPSADFCPVVRSPHGTLSRRSDTEQISWGKFSRLPCTVAESTLRVLDGYGPSRYVARSSDARALYPVLVHRLARLLYASFRPRLAATALALSLTLHLPSGWVEDLHLQATEHAQHTTKSLRDSPLRGCLTASDNRGG